MEIAALVLERVSGEFGVEPEFSEDNDDTEVLFDEWTEMLVRVAIVKGKDADARAYDTIKHFLKNVFLPLCRARLSLLCVRIPRAPETHI
eukprot:1187616-Prorocentrum_minimum.AAC.4